LLNQFGLLVFLFLRKEVMFNRESALMTGQRLRR